MLPSNTVKSCRVCGYELPSSEYSTVGSRVCDVCHDPDPLWLDGAPIDDFYRHGDLARWARDADLVLDDERRVVMGRIGRLFDELPRLICSRASDSDMFWNTLLGALLVSCHNTACTLAGMPDKCVWPDTPRRREKTAPFKSVEAALRFALRGVNLGLGALALRTGEQSGVPAPRNLQRAELLMDVAGAVRAAGVSPEDLGIVVAAKLGIRGRKIRNHQIARSLETTPGVIRRRLAHSYNALQDALMERGMIDAEKETREAQGVARDR